MRSESPAAKGSAMSNITQQVPVGFRRDEGSQLIALDRVEARTSSAAKRKGASGLAEAPPHYHGHRERLRERFREAGAAALADYEMLELILFRAIPQRDVKPLAKTLLEKFGSFAEVIAAPRPRLAEVNGLGDAAITELKVVHAAASRLAHGAVKKRPAL